MGTHLRGHLRDAWGAGYRLESVHFERQPFPFHENFRSWRHMRRVFAGCSSFLTNYLCIIILKATSIYILHKSRAAPCLALAAMLPAKPAQSKRKQARNEGWSVWIIVFRTFFATSEAIQISNAFHHQTLWSPKLQQFLQDIATCNLAKLPDDFHHFAALHTRYSTAQSIASPRALSLSCETLAGFACKPQRHRGYSRWNGTGCFLFGTGSEICSGDTVP